MFTKNALKFGVLIMWMGMGTGLGAMACITLHEKITGKSFTVN